MKRRCEFLDNCPAFNYNVGASEYIVNKDGQPCKNDTRQLGSTLMDTMLREVSDFCDPIIRENWALKPHHQVRLKLRTVLHVYTCIIMREFIIMSHKMSWHMRCSGVRISVGNLNDVFFIHTCMCISYHV